MAEPAARLLSRRRFELLARIARVLGRHDVRSCRVLAGVSGGGDSMALLEILAELAPSLDVEVEVACVDHGLRTAARDEQRLVESACRRLGTPFHLLRVTPDDSGEDACRRVRRRALEELAQQRGCAWIVLAHTADDQIETVILRFLRGAGLGGLSAMDVVAGNVLRPLLAVRRTELRELLRERGVAWAEDETNLTERYARGRLRTLVLPALVRAFGRGAVDHLLESASHWRRDHEFLDREATRLEAFCRRRGSDGRPELDLVSLNASHEALRARVLQRWLGDVGSLEVPDASYVEQLLEMTGAGEGAAGLDLPGVRVWCENGRLRSLPAGTGGRLAAARVGEHAGPTDVLPPAKGRVRLPRVKKNS